MYSMYAGDFATAITEARRVQKENPKLEYAYLPEALSQLAQGDTAAASRELPSALGDEPARRFVRAAWAQADMAMYFGRHRDAVRCCSRASRPT